MNFYLSQKSFVEPLFDVESLPLACKLPMVCVPVGWGVEDGRSKRVIPKVGELVGCYLNPGTYNMSLPFRLHNTKESDHYYALFTTREILHSIVLYTYTTSKCWFS